MLEVTIWSNFLLAMSSGGCEREGRQASGGGGGGGVAGGCSACLVSSADTN